MNISNILLYINGTSLCRNCHKLFDNGCIGVDNNILLFSDNINIYKN
jgi:predicted restriction endonuclease